MAATIEVEYYNTYWLKFCTSPIMIYKRPLSGTTGPSEDFQAFVPVFPGIEDRGNGNSFPAYNFPVFPYTSSFTYGPISNVNSTANVKYNNSEGVNWVIEEGRIYGDYNGAMTSRGLHAYLKQENNEATQRKSGLIFSGIYNSRTSFNQTNVFSVNSDITKSVDPHNGSIQLIDAMDNDLTIFQENKVSQALIDKDAIYSAEGSGAPVTTKRQVIGQVTPYTGEYGISVDPESFAKFGYRRYFSDKFRSAVLRLSRDGITEISKYGMTDWFRDNLSLIDDTLTSYSSSNYKVVFSKNTGEISQDPRWPLQTNPTPLEEVGPWIEINNDGGTVDLNSFYNDIELGAFLELSVDGGVSFQTYSITVTGFGEDVSNNKLYVYLTQASLPISYSPGIEADIRIRFTYFKSPRIIGGFDTYKDNYIISLQKFSGTKSDDLIDDYEDNSDPSTGYYSTLCFDEGPKGWTTFYTYRPDFIFSIKNNLYTTFSNNAYTNSNLQKQNITGLYKHYANNNFNTFYKYRKESSVIFVFNGNPSLNKNFLTINYEGNDGWQVDYMRSDILDGNFDKTNVILSYSQGLYTEKGVDYRSGFNIKSNKFYANLVNNSEAMSGEVVYGSSMSGIKGYFATVKMSTDGSTNVNTPKELFSVGTEFSVSNRN